MRTQSLAAELSVLMMTPGVNGPLQMRTLTNHNTYLNLQISLILAALATMNSFTLVVMETEPVTLPTSMLCR